MVCWEVENKALAPMHAHVSREAGSMEKASLTCVSPAFLIIYEKKSEKTRNC